MDDSNFFIIATFGIIFALVGAYLLLGGSSSSNLLEKIFGDEKDK